MNAFCFGLYTWIDRPVAWMHNGRRLIGTVTTDCATATQAGVPVPLCAPVAQLDRALAYEARGRVFESPRAYHLNSHCLIGLAHSLC